MQLHLTAVYFEFVQTTKQREKDAKYKERLKTFNKDEWNYGLPRSLSDEFEYGRKKVSMRD
jgi:hypothetical protein